MHEKCRCLRTQARPDNFCCGMSLDLTIGYFDSTLALASTDTKYSSHKAGNSLPPSFLKTLMVALVLPRLYYCNVLLAGLPGRLNGRLSSIQQQSQKIRQSDTTSFQTSLKIQFRLIVLIQYWCLYGLVPSYLCVRFRKITDTFDAYDHRPPVLS